MIVTKISDSEKKRETKSEGEEQKTTNGTRSELETERKTAYGKGNRPWMSHHHCENGEGKDTIDRVDKFIPNTVDK